MEYKIVGADGCNELEHKVNKLIKEGWILQGGITCMLVSSPKGMSFKIEYFYYQAMKKGEYPVIEEDK